MSCLEAGVDASTEPSTIDVTILDGAAIVQLLAPGTVRTFFEYAQHVFIPYVKKQLENTTRLDIVWDVYRPDSLKGTTGQKRGKGVRRRVEGSSAMPR